METARPFLTLLFCLSALLLLFSAVVGAEEDDATPVEFGGVAWLRDFDAALEQAKAKERSILLLFQEVPGWGTCKRYGSQVLAHPLVIDAAESLFVPAAVRNNSKGDDDEAVRKAFEEPAWNNPVVRVVDHEKKDVVPRLSGDYSLPGLLAKMKAALEAREQEAPLWFTLFEREAAARTRGIETAVFGMGWFWVGEVQLGLLPGVVATRPGWLERREVVEVTYDPSVLEYDDLVLLASKRDCAMPVFVRSDAQHEVATKIVGDKVVRTDGEIRTTDDKYYLSRTPLKFLPMTPLQATVVNTAVREGKGRLDAETGLLSPGQERLLETITAHPEAGWESAIGADFLEAWAKATKRAADL